MVKKIKFLAYATLKAGVWHNAKKAAFKGPRPPKWDRALDKGRRSQCLIPWRYGSFEPCPFFVRKKPPALRRGLVLSCAKGAGAHNFLHPSSAQLGIVLIEHAEAVGIPLFPRLCPAAEVKDDRVGHHPVHIRLSVAAQPVAVVIAGVVVPDDIVQVEIQAQTNQILFTNKDNTKIYKTGMVDDPGRTQRLYESGAKFSGEIIEQMSPLLSFLLTWILP